MKLLYRIFYSALYCLALIELLSPPAAVAQQASLSDMNGVIDYAPKQRSSGDNSVSRHCCQLAIALSLGRRSVPPTQMIMSTRGCALLAWPGTGTEPIVGLLILLQLRLVDTTRVDPGLYFPAARRTA